MHENTGPGVLSPIEKIYAVSETGFIVYGAFSNIFFSNCGAAVYAVYACDAPGN